MMWHQIGQQNWKKKTLLSTKKATAATDDAGLVAKLIQSDYKQTYLNFVCMFVQIFRKSGYSQSSVETFVYMMQSYNLHRASLSTDETIK